MVDNTAHVVSQEQQMKYQNGVNPPTQIVEDVSRFAQMGYPDQNVMKTKSGQAFVVKGNFKDGQITVYKNVDFSNAEKTFASELKQLAAVSNEQDIVYRDINRILANRHVPVTLKNADTLFNDVGNKIFSMRNDDERKSKGDMRATMGDFLRNWKESVKDLNNEMSASFKVLSQVYPDRATEFATNCSVMIQDMSNNPVLGDYFAENFTFRHEIEKYQKAHADTKEMDSFHKSQEAREKLVENAKASVLSSVQEKDGISANAMFKKYLENTAGKANLSKEEVKAMRENFDRAVNQLVKDNQLSTDAYITKFSFKQPTKSLRSVPQNNVSRQQEKGNSR